MCAEKQVSTAWVSNKTLININTRSGLNQHILPTAAPVSTFLSLNYSHEDAVLQIVQYFNNNVKKT